jgi:hypothetical protein
MTDLSKLRQGLRCCINWENLKGHLPECESCPYADEREGTCAEMTAILTDALDAITPRLLTLDEVIDRLDDAVYLEERGDGVTAEIVTDTDWEIDAVWLRHGWYQRCWEMSDYGREWRCWSMRPGDAERKAAWAD